MFELFKNKIGKAGGIGLDIPVTKTVIADNNNKQNFLNYRLQAGMIASSLEHQTPEQMYNTDPANPVQGISTMKAFALANQQGQKIYTITQANINEVLPKIQASSLTKGDISSSVNAGKTVTVHEREVSVSGWTGTGYMVTDPVNGDGAYLISGGGNGGWAEIIETGLIPAFIDVFTPPMISIIYTAITSFNDMLACLESGNYFAVAAFIIMSLIFIYFMTLLITAAMAGGVGFIFMGIFATTMELMFSEMNAGILETC